MHRSLHGTCTLDCEMSEQDRMPQGALHSHSLAAFPPDVGFQKEGRNVLPSSTTPCSTFESDVVV